MSKPRVVVAMSGGVDSSVAAAMMVEQGYDVVGIALQLWDYSGRDDDSFGSCCSPDDLYDARRVAYKLDMPFYVSNAQDAFKGEVVDRFTEDYLAGLTPNPCVRCNDTVKFERLLKLALGLDAQYLVTGHYCRIDKSQDGIYHLKAGVDEKKDQSYFLFNLRQDQLAHILFPLGNMNKDEVRAYAKSRGLPTASKHESMEICFVGNRNYADFVEKQVDAERIPKAGPIVDVDGTVLGQHRGIHHYTIGQRRGLHLPGGGPIRYVVAIDGDRVIVGGNEDLWQQGIVALGINWMAGYPPKEGTVFQARIRHHGKLVSARVHHVEGHKTYIQLLEAHRAISSGQAIVLYQGDEVLGGGWIEGPFQIPPATPELPTNDKINLGLNL